MRASDIIREVPDIIILRTSKVACIGLSLFVLQLLLIAI